MDANISWLDVSRSTAIKNNLNKYTGSPCNKCGNSIRYTTSSNCIKCTSYVPTGKKVGGSPLPERIAAINADEEFYVTGKPCKHGHISKRYVKNSLCFECTKTVLKDMRRGKERQYSLAKYKISPQEYDRLFDLQNGKCAICKNSEINIDHNTKQIRKLAVDHCHFTRKNRELLCSACNLGIGLFNHDADRLRLAADYCEKHK